MEWYTRWYGISHTCHNWNDLWWGSYLFRSWRAMPCWSHCITKPKYSNDIIRKYLAISNRSQHSFSLQKCMKNKQTKQQTWTSINISCAVETVRSHRQILRFVGKFHRAHHNSNWPKKYLFVDHTEIVHTTIQAAILRQTKWINTQFIWPKRRFRMWTYL